MARNQYDAIVVGARCAGSPTAMLLARKGYKVLVVDQATFPSDTISTHLIHPPGVAALAAMGPARPARGDGMPADRHLRVRLRTLHDLRAPPAPTTPRSRTARGGPCSTSCSWTPRPRREPRSGRGSPSRRSSSRTAASPAFAATARAASPSPSTPAWSSAPTACTRSSRETVGAEQYNEKPPLLAELLHLLERAADERPLRGLHPTATGRSRRGRRNDDLTLVIGGWPFAEFEANKKDIEGNYLKVIELAPAFADRIRAARREERFVGTAVPNYFRKPFGPGWALVGDAGYNKDFITAQGISDAFRDAELCADRAGRGVLRRPLVRRGDGRVPVHARRARPADVRVHLPARDAGAAAARACSSSWRPCTATRRRWTGSRASIAGVTSPAEFFSEENVGRIFATAR